ncbi:MAG TPA: exodeoxyribonuclease VII large subunit, partial [Rhodobiaceae bacterium]|nr:exodeoxyribonuclease VII large subunit [Rhodobiaceae bacterium]
DPARKRPLPFLPATIGVVTSPSGAVIRDILHRLCDRFPRHVLVWPVRVQGEQSAEEVTAAIKGFNELKPGGPVPRPDLLIVARGGGSLEDLWSFNEEMVVRAAAASEIPLISAVGHETDTTLIDFASDQRAPTPTAAAEMAVPVRADLVARVLDNARRLVRGETRKVTELSARLEGLGRGLPKPDDLFALPGQRLDHASQRLGLGLGAAASAKRSQLERIAGRLSGQVLTSKLANGHQRTQDLAARATRAEQRHLTDLGKRLGQAGRLLDTLSYQGVLSRGFALVRDKNGEPVRGSAGIEQGTELELEFAGSDKLAVTTGPSTDKAGTASTVAPKAAPKAKRSVSKKKSAPGGDQGQLF